MTTRRDFLRLGALATVAPLVVPAAEYVRKFFPVGIDLRSDYNRMPYGLVDLPNGVPWMEPHNGVWTVRDAAEFRIAVNSARDGETIQLAPGTVLRGNFVLPSRPSSGWLTIGGDGRIGGAL